MSYWEVVPDEESSPVMDADGVVRWRLPDKRLHRLGGPAIERPDGDRSWWEHGKLHRLDGPARVGTNGREEYWIHGYRLSEKAFNRRRSR